MSRLVTPGGPGGRPAHDTSSSKTNAALRPSVHHATDEEHAKTAALLKRMVIDAEKATTDDAT